MDNPLSSLLNPVVNKIHSIQARRLTAFIHCSKVNSCLHAIRSIPLLIMQTNYEGKITSKMERHAKELFQTILEIDQLITPCCSESCVKFLLSSSVREPKKMFRELRLRAAQILSDLGVDSSEITIKEDDLCSQDAVDMKRIAQLMIKISETNSDEAIQKRFRSLESIGISTAQIDSGNIIIPVLPNHLNLVYKHDEIKLADEELGSGQSGVVRLGTIKATGQRVAVKIMLRKSFSQADFESFRREIHTLSVLHHNNLIKFHGYTDEFPFYIITEYAEHGSLYDVLRNSPDDLTPTMRSIIACDVARGLVYLHEHGTIHRDMKSLNVLLSSDYRASICDFGMARTKSQQPMTGLVGTAHWMAPEVILSRPTYDEKVDVYSFGIILWELLTGEIPYSDMPMNKVAILVIEQNMRPAIPNNAPRALVQLIQSCWNSDPSKRPSMSVVLNKLMKPELHFIDTDETEFVKAMSPHPVNIAKRSGSVYQRKLPTLGGIDVEGIVAMLELAAKPNESQFMKQLLDALVIRKSADAAAEAGAVGIIIPLLREKSDKSMYALDRLAKCSAPRMFEVPMLKALLEYSSCSNRMMREKAILVLLNACDLRYDFLCGTAAFLPLLLQFFEMHVDTELAGNLLSLVSRLIGALDTMPTNVFPMLLNTLDTQGESQSVIISCLVSTLRFESTKINITEPQWIKIIKNFKICQPVIVQYCDSQEPLSSDAIVVDHLFRHKHYTFISTLVSNHRFLDLIMQHIPINDKEDDITCVYRSLLVDDPGLVARFAPFEEFYRIASHAITIGRCDVICGCMRKCHVNVESLMKTNLIEVLSNAIPVETRPDQLVSLMAAAFSILNQTAVPELVSLAHLFESWLFSEVKPLRMPAFLCLASISRYSADIDHTKLVVAAAYFISVDSTLMREVSSRVIVSHVQQIAGSLKMVFKIFTENFNESHIDDNVRSAVSAMTHAFQTTKEDIDQDLRAHMSHIYHVLQQS